jgi:hypothetical protein
MRDAQQGVPMRRLTDWQTEVFKIFKTKSFVYWFQIPYICRLKSEMRQTAFK